MKKMTKEELLKAVMEIYRREEKKNDQPQERCYGSGYLPEGCIIQGWSEEELRKIVKKGVEERLRKAGYPPSFIDGDQYENSYNNGL